MIDFTINGAQRSLPEAQPKKRLIAFGVFELDLDAGELRKQGVRIKLQEQPLQILQILLEHPGEIVTREALRNRIWSADTFVDFDKGLYNAIKKLREALGDTAATPRFIETIPKRGYRFMAPVGDREAPKSKLALVPTPPPPDEPQGEPVVPQPHLLTWKKKIALSALVLVVVAGSGLWYQRHLPLRSRLTEKDQILLADFSNSTGEAVFDDTLKQALNVDLQQSTFLNIVPDDVIYRQLRYMGRSLETRLTPEVAREVCLRGNAKAMLTGSISPLGSHYVITLRAVDCASGNLLHIEQLEAESRERILGRLHEAGRRVREKLGESLPSIQKNDTPLEQATTSSLEALQVYSNAGKVYRSQGEAAAVPLFKRALEIDPKFAVAIADLGMMYCNLGETALCSSHEKQAYELRDRATGKERFYIDSNFYTDVTGELEKASEVLEQWKQEYPRDLAPYINLGSVTSSLGQLDTALTNDLEGHRLRPDSLALFRSLSSDYMNLNRLEDAEHVLKLAKAQQMELPLLQNFYRLAFLRSDAKEIEQSMRTASGHADVESSLLSSQADTEAYYGRLALARDYTSRAVRSSLASGAKEDAAGWLATQALREAEFGNAARAQQSAQSALVLSSSKNVQVAAAIAYARSGNRTSANAIASDLRAKFPLDTLIIHEWLPTIRAAELLSGGDAKGALAELEISLPYELGGTAPPFVSGATLYPAYLRGLAYQKNKQPEKAAAEFNKIIAHRGLVWNFPLGALAQLELGRTYAAAGKSAQAKAAYDDFLKQWHDADGDVPVLQNARSEYRRLP